MAFYAGSASNGTLENFLTHYQPGDIGWVSITGSTLLIEALGNSDRQNRSDIANFLLDEGADATIQTPRGNNGLHVLIGMADYQHPETDLALLVRLLDSGADINAVSQKSGTPLKYLFETTINFDESLAVPFYEVFFSRPDLDLLSLAGKNSTYTAIAKGEFIHPIATRRMNEYLEARGITVPKAN